MVHNGIEYGDMQLICEAYHLMKNALNMAPDEMSEVSEMHFRITCSHFREFLERHNPRFY